MLRVEGVSIEFWGRENDPKYRERMAAKQAIYAKHNLRLIELGDAEIERPDECCRGCCCGLGLRVLEAKLESRSAYVEATEYKT